MVSADEMSFTVEITSDAIVRHDSRAVESIVLNLLVNAYKYTSDPKKIVLRLKDVGDSVVLEVEDNGIGILETEFNKIFDPFYRVDSRLRGKASGAGLGLAIVKHNAALHGADVSVVSSEGNGSKFIVNFTVEQQKDAV
jgi:signal transduction histidine kinase